MKKFKDLSINDKVYVCHNVNGKLNYTSLPIDSLSKTGLRITLPGKYGKSAGFSGNAIERLSGESVVIVSDMEGVEKAYKWMLHNAEKFKEEMTALIMADKLKGDK